MKPLCLSAPAALLASFVLACAGDESSIDASDPSGMDAGNSNGMDAGNSNGVDASAVNDTTPPTCRIASPVDLATGWHSSNLTLAGTARDGQSGVAALRVTLDGTANDVSIAPAPGTDQSWTTDVALHAGTNSLLVQAVDVAGNVGTCVLEGSTQPAPWSVNVDPEPPTVYVRQNLLYDERQIAISFDANARPCYGRYKQDLAQPTCPDVVMPTDNIALDGMSTESNTHVYKYVSRLSGTNEVKDNPIRWYLDASDTGGSDVATVQFRVSWPAAPGVAAGGTAWLDATPGMPLADVKYLADVTTTTMGANAAKLRMAGVWSIEFRALDLAGNTSAVIAAQWDHHPMAPPLQVRAVLLGQTDPRSIQFYRLHPTLFVPAPGSMAKLIDGNFGPSEAAGVARWEIRNGTDEDAYVQFVPGTNQGFYQGSTVARNVKIGEGAGSTMCEGPSYETPRQISPTSICPYTPLQSTETCFAGTLSGSCLGTVPVTIGDKVIMEDGPSEEQLGCVGCDSNEWIIAKRNADGTPNTRTVILAASDFSFLSPVASGLSSEISITEHNTSPVTLTGQKDERYVTCRMWSSIEMCLGNNQMQRYHALKRARIDAYDLMISLRARTDLSNAADFYYNQGAPLYTQDPTDPTALKVATYLYNTTEPNLP